MKYKNLCISAVLYSASIVYAATPFVVSTGGLEVSDSKTGLIWKRCVEGMVFDGITCKGTPLGFFSHEVALAHARDFSINTGVAWRMPNIKELQSITDTTRYGPAIDIVAFPETPGTYHLSSSPHVNLSSNVWLVNFYIGSTEPFYRTHNYSFATYYLRLVRSNQ